MDFEVIFRIIFAIGLFGAFGISTIYRRRAREEGGTIERREEGYAVLLLRMGFGLPLLISLLLYIFYPRGISWSFTTVPLLARWVFSAVVLLSIPIFLAVFRNIGKNISETILVKEGHDLVTTGPYRWVRHPLYATAILLIGSLGVVSTSWFIFAYFVLAFTAFRFIVVPQEEKLLIKTFGDQYVKYQKTTGALFPKVF